MSESNRAIVIVHWPGKDVPACANHLLKLQGLAGVLGFGLSSTPILDLDQAPLCSNCENEAKANP